MIFLTLPYPISANRYWATRVVKAKGTQRYMAMTYVTPEAKEYRLEVLKRFAAAGYGAQIEGRLSVAIHLYPHRPLDWKTRMRKLGELWDDTVQCIDLGNAEKVLSDALQGLAFADDKRVRMLQLQRMEPDEQGARVEIWICQMPTEQRQQSITDQTTLETA